MIKPMLGLALALVITAGPAGAAECAPLPDDMKCHAENGDARAMYLVGREAYEEGRKTGDFSEAYMWANRAMEAKFFPAAKMLYKMVHLQAGDGNHHDLVEAHQWITKAIAGGADYLVPYKRRLEAKMTAEQIAEAHKLEQ